MSKRPEPMMACAECGPVVREPVTRCPLCGSPEVSWIDLAAGLDHLALQGYAPSPVRLLTDAAHRLRALEAQFEALVDYSDVQGGAKRRRQELKAARLAEVIRVSHLKANQDKMWADRQDIEGMTDAQWSAAMQLVNDRWPNDPIGPPSQETKALVAQKFAQPQGGPPWMM